MNEQEKQHVTDTFIRGFHFARAKMNEGIDRTQLPFCDPDPHHPKHNNVMTGDPCWCGSDNCSICTICGLENHD